jgi:Endomembrane protein 70.
MASYVILDSLHECSVIFLSYLGGSEWAVSCVSDILCYSFDFCGTHDEASPVENLGQVVFGERIRPSPYKVLTKHKIYDSHYANQFQWVWTDYHLIWG